MTKSKDTIFADVAGMIHWDDGNDPDGTRRSREAALHDAIDEIDPEGQPCHECGLILDPGDGGTGGCVVWLNPGWGEPEGPVCLCWECRNELECA